MQEQWQCQQVLLKFFHLLDAKRYDELVALFDEGGVWTRPGGEMRGHVQIAEAMLRRPVHRVTRHLVSNFLVLEEGGGQVDAIALLTTYAFEGVAQPPVVNGPVGIFRARVRFGCTAEAIHIERLDLAPEFSLTH